MLMRRAASPVVSDRFIPLAFESSRYRTRKDTALNPNSSAIELQIASALGILGDHDNRIFQFTHIHKPRLRNEVEREKSLQQYRQNKKQRKRLPYRVLSAEAVRSKVGLYTLHAPGLLNDFYSSLVAWSPVSRHVAVGLGSQTFLWILGQGSELLRLPTDYGQVSCLDFSQSNILAIGRKDGSLMIYDVGRTSLRGVYMHVEAPLCFVRWLPQCDTDLFIGDELGTVRHLKVEAGDHEDDIKAGALLKCHTQQICGIEVSQDLTQMAIGGNDNMVTVWDMTKVASPQLQFRMYHKAAVKALAFCPWAPGLLVTGGGTHDRTVRFWHSRTGTLLTSHHVPGQVTGVVWSRHYKQLAVTYGFGDHERPVLAAVYAYPRFVPLIQIPPSSVTRLLSTVLSPDGDSICCAANDGTVRFYELWHDTKGKVSTPQEGLYGSDIIQMLEGIDKQGESIR